MHRDFMNTNDINHYNLLLQFTVLHMQYKVAQLRSHTFYSIYFLKYISYLKRMYIEEICRFEIACCIQKPKHLQHTFIY